MNLTSRYAGRGDSEGRGQGRACRKRAPCLPRRIPRPPRRRKRLGTQRKRLISPGFGGAEEAEEAKASSSKASEEEGDRWATPVAGAKEVEDTPMATEAKPSEDFGETPEPQEWGETPLPGATKKKRARWAPRAWVEVEC